MTDDDQLCKCTRCRNQHRFGDRPKVRDRRHASVSHFVCPRCNCQSYYKLKPAA